MNTATLKLSITSRLHPLPGQQRVDAFGPFADGVPIPVIALRPDTQGDTYAEIQPARLPWGIPGLYQHNEATWKDQVKERLERPLTEEDLARGYEYAAYIQASRLDLTIIETYPEDYVYGVADSVIEYVANSSYLESQIIWSVY